MRMVDSCKIFDLVGVVEGIGCFVWVRDIYEVK